MLNQTGIKKFENDVKMYGTQARYYRSSDHCLFENDVKMYGTQANLAAASGEDLFENDVNVWYTSVSARNDLQQFV